jgi:hypothetical protein
LPAGARRDAEKQTRDNLKQIALAMHNYVDQQGTFPPSAIYAADGATPLLSWRVALLPYLGEGQLYRQFKFDEPWDSEHNKKLLAQMPAVYRVAALQPRGATATYYQVIVGNGCVFEEPRPGGAGGSDRAVFPDGPRAGAAAAPGSIPGRGGPGGPPRRGGFPGGVPGGPGMGGGMPGMPGGVAGGGVRLADITDGTSNTLLVVEGETAVPWTQPVDIPYSAAGKVPQLGGLFPEVFHAAFADGSVHTLDKQIDETTLRRLITRADGQPVNLEAVTEPVLTSDPEQLRRENRDLAAEVARMRQELAELKWREAEGHLSGGDKRAGVQTLRLEQKRLRRERDDLRVQVERLRNQLIRQELRPPTDGTDG